MANSENGSDELDKLLAEVQRTIRENSQFIRNLKEEAAASDEAEIEEEPARDLAVGEEDYEEL